MAEGAEALFTFDPNPLVTALNKFTEAFQKTQKTTEKSSKDMEDAFGKALKSFAAKAALLVGAYRTIKGAVTKYIPEIGRTFSIAGDIFMRNFMWPLRQVLMPYLQKILNWTRDHRSMFVQWGVGLANVFRVVMTMFEQVWRVIKKIGSVIGDYMAEKLGGTTKTFGEFLNLFTAKLAAVFIFLGMLLEDFLSAAENTIKGLLDIAFELIGIFTDVGGAMMEGILASELFDSKLSKFWSTVEKIVNFFKKLISAIREGLAPLLPHITKAFQSLGDAFNQLFGAIGELFDLLMGGDGESAMKFISDLATIIGTVFVVAIQAAAMVIDTFATALKALVYLLKAAWDLFNGDWEGAAKNWEKVTEAGEAYAGRMKKRGAAIGSAVKTGYETVVQDAIITKRGDIIRTSPEDNIIATKIPVDKFGGGGGRNINISLAPTVQLTVTEGNAERAGKNFISGMGSNLSQLISQQRMAEGY